MPPQLRRCRHDAVEQSAAYVIDNHPAVASFVKNAGLGFAIPYFHHGQPHDYEPDFIIKLAAEPQRYLILEVKGYDPVSEVKAQAANRWVAAVNADARHGAWSYAMVRKVGDVPNVLTVAAGSLCDNTTGASMTLPSSRHNRLYLRNYSSRVTL